MGLVLGALFIAGGAWKELLALLALWGSGEGSGRIQFNRSRLESAMMVGSWIQWFVRMIGARLQRGKGVNEKDWDDGVHDCNVNDDESCLVAGLVFGIIR
jgi:hypothetical protein